MAKKIKTSTQKSSDKAVAVTPKVVAGKEVAKNSPVNKSKKYWWLVVILLIVGGLWLTRGIWLAATVNNKPIWRFKVVKLLESQAGSVALEQLIAQELLHQEAIQKGIVVTDQEVTDEINKLKSELEPEGLTYETWLLQSGMTAEVYEQDVRFRKLAEKVLADRLEVSDDEAKAYFDQYGELSFPDTDFEEVKDTIKMQLKGQKLQQEFQLWLEEATGNANVQNFVNY